MNTQKIAENISATKEWYLRNERRLIPAALLGGFIFDWLTVTRIDRLYENILLMVYMLIAAAGITIINLYDAGRLTAAAGNVRMERILSWMRITAPLVVQFAFGGLFSVFLVLYSRGGALAVSWIFLLLLLGLMIGNDLFQKHYRRLSVQVSVLFFCVLLFSIFFLPIMLSTFGTSIFLLAGLLSLLLILIYVQFLRSQVPVWVNERIRGIAIGISGVFVVVNLLYLANIVPPLPLSMQRAEVVHTVDRIGKSAYEVEIESRSRAARLADWLWFIPDEITASTGEPVYFFSSVFAPTDLTLDITHQWEYYDAAQNSWTDAGSISFPVRGGREDGYRGYSLKRNTHPGDWRVSVETPDGRVIGRRNFRINQVTGVDQLPPLETEVW